MIYQQETRKYMRRGSGICSFVFFAAFALSVECGTVQAQNITSTYEYDANGNLIRTADGLNKITSIERDELGRAKNVVYPPSFAGQKNPSINFGHDSRDAVTSVIDPLGHTTSYDVDGFGNNRAIVSPDTGVTKYVFDEKNALSTKVDARKIPATYSFDDIGRLKSISYSVGAPTTFEYDGGPQGAASSKGRLTKVTDSSGITTYGYTAFGEINTKSQTIYAEGKSVSHNVTYSYGSAGAENGKLTRLTYPSGTRLVIGYNSAGQAKSISFNPMNSAGNGTDTSKLVKLIFYGNYDAEGRVISWAWGNTTTAVPSGYGRQYDISGRISGYYLGNLSQGGAVRMLMFDEANRIKSYTHFVGPYMTKAPELDQTFDYDGNDRLTQFVSFAGSQSFKYDDNGNRTQLIIGSSSYANSINASNNRLASSTGPGQPRTMQYDDAGNLSSDGKALYTYSASGRMATSKVGTVVTNYLYNGFGQRVWQKENGQTSNSAGVYVYDEDGHLIGEYDTLTGKPKREIVYLQDIPIAVLSYQSTGAGAAQVWSVDVAYIYTDHLNTPRVITRASDNKIVWRWTDVDPFGMLGPNENPSALGTFSFNLRMPGQYFDKSSNLFYNYHRDYDPQTGRYVQSDPIGLLGGINTYGYVNGNPLSFTDPEGHVALAVPGIVGVGIIGCYFSTGCMQSLRDLGKKIADVCFNSSSDDANNGQPKKDGEGSTPEEIANSSGGPTAGKPVRPGDRERVLEEGKDENGNYTCWRCGWTTTDPSKIDIGHKNVPRSEGGNLHPDNLACEGKSCNRSAGNRGAPKPGSSCMEKRGGC